MSENIERLKEVLENMSPDILLEAPEFTQQLFEFSPDAIVIVDDRGRIRLMNRQAEITFGWHRNELAGMDLGVLLPEQYREAHIKHIQAYLREPRLRPMGVFLGNKPIGALEGLRRNGEIFAVEINLAPIQTMQGLFVIATIRKRKHGDTAG